MLFLLLEKESVIPCQKSQSRGAAADLSVPCPVSGLGLIFEYVLKIPMGFIPSHRRHLLIALLVACCQNRALSFDESSR